MGKGKHLEHSVMDPTSPVCLIEDNWQTADQRFFLRCLAGNISGLLEFSNGARVPVMLDRNIGKVVESHH